MSKEIWKDVVGYEGIYQVSNLGRVKTLARMKKKNKDRIRKTEHFESIRERILNPPIIQGYYRIELSKDGKSRKYFVHRLVASAFIPNSEDLEFVNHKDENKLNNTFENLEWCDKAYNNLYGTRVERITSKNTNGKCSKKVAKIKDGIIIETFPSIAEVCRVYGFESGNISLCCTGKRKTAYGFNWKHLEVENDK